MPSACGGVACLTSSSPRYRCMNDTLTAAVNTTGWQATVKWQEIVASASSHYAVSADVLHEHRIGGTKSSDFPPTASFLTSIVARAVFMAEQYSGLVLTSWRADIIHNSFVRPTLEQQLCHADRLWSGGTKRLFESPSPPPSPPAYRDGATKAAPLVPPCPVINLCDLRRLLLARRNLTNVHAPGEMLKLAYRGKVIDTLRFLVALERARPGTDVVFADGNDVAWAQCHPHLHPLIGLRNALDVLRRASNASIFFNAELADSECVEPCPVPSVDAIRASWVSAVCPNRLPIACTPLGMTPSRPGTSLDTTEGRCYPLYLNSGVFAGAASRLLPMVHWVAQHFRWHPAVVSDQGVYLAWFVAHQREVTLDYCSALVHTMLAVPDHAYARVLAPRAAGASSSVSAAHGTLPQVLHAGNPTCLLHDQGHLRKCTRACSASWRASLNVSQQGISQ